MVTLLNKKYDCIHRIIYIVGGISGGSALYYLSSGDYITGGLIILSGGLITEFVHKYLTHKPEVVLVTQSSEEKDEEFIEKIQHKVIETIKEREKENKK